MKACRWLPALTALLWIGIISSCITSPEVLNLRPTALPLADVSGQVVLEAAAVPVPAQGSIQQFSRPLGSIPATGLQVDSTYAPGSAFGYTAVEIVPGQPAFSGMVLYCDENDGYCLWMPAGWYLFELNEERGKVLFSPYPADQNTGFSVEKITFEGQMGEPDLNQLRSDFLQEVEALPGVVIESQSESLVGGLVILEARLTFLDGDIRRERWVKTAFLGSTRLNLVAQGRTPEDFDYWLPLFYNMMNNVSL